MREKEIIIGDNLVHYYHYENPGAAAVIFLHGWRSEGKIWSPICELLLQSPPKFNIFVLDLPGFGKSEMPKRTFDLIDYSQVVLTFIQKVRLEKVALVGHSFGGRIAIKTAITAQERVQKLVLVNSAGFRLHRTRNATIRIFAKIFKPVFSLRFLSGVRMRIYRFLGAEDYLATPKLRETFMKVISEDLSALLPYIRQKTLIIWGGKDKDTPLFLALWLKENIRHSELVVFDDAGHYSFLDQPEKFVNLTANFLKD